MIGSCISAIMVDNKNAVTIYFAISISHLPNGLLHVAKLTSIFEITKSLYGKCPTQPAR